jgi:hypothetical protein
MANRRQKEDPDSTSGRAVVRPVRPPSDQRLLDVRHLSRKRLSEATDGKVPKMNEQA